MNERDLESLAKRLGVESAERLDVDRVAERVVARLRADRDRPPIWASRSTLWRAAAAAALLVTAGVLARHTLQRGPSEQVANANVPVLGGLSTDELQEVFDSLALDAPVHEAVSGGLESLTEAQLKELLRLMEG
jgi:hypothetical protein